MIRWSTIALFIGALLAGVLYDRVENSDVPVELELGSAAITPELTYPALLSSDWYCPIGSTNDGGFASTTVYVSNLSDDEAFATIETLTESGPGSGLRIELAPRTTEAIDLATLTEAAPAVGAVVEIIGGEGVVGHRVETPEGMTEGPCSTATSDVWYFGGGITTRDSRYYLAVMNPSPNPVIFSAIFRTETRVREPQDLESAVVSARSVELIDVTEYVAREALVSAEIRTVEGHLVVERLQTFDGSLGPQGATLQLGVARPATQWFFGSGTLSDSGDSKLAITNPSDAVAELDLYLDPTDPSDRVSYGLLPRELTIAPGRTIVLDLDRMADEIGLRLPYELGLRLESVNDIAVVAERWHLSPGVDETLIGAGGVNAKGKPALRQDGETGEIPIEEAPTVFGAAQLVQEVPDVGAVLTRGVEQRSTRWVVPWVELVPDAGTALILTGGDEAATVEARLLVAGEWQPPIRALVEANGRIVLPIRSAAEAAPIVITSTAPIVVEAQVVELGVRHDIVSAIPTVIR